MKKQGIVNQTDMQFANLMSVYHILYEHAPLSRAELTKRTGMSPTSISRFVDRMIRAGLVSEKPNETKKVGRTAILLDLIESASYCVGINVDSTYIHVSILNLRLKVVADKYIQNTMEPPQFEEVLSVIYQLYLQLLEESGIEASQIHGLGLCIAGFMKTEDVLDFTAQLQWKGLNLRKRLQEKFGFENILIENDCNAALLGQLVKRPGLRQKDVACIVLGTGVGSAVAYQGKLLKQKGNMAFSEIGHTIVEPNGMLCECGNRGCLQTYIAENHLLYRAKLHDDQVDTLDKLYMAWKEEKPWARNLIQQANNYIKLAINNIACVYNPELVLVGGDTMDNYHEMFADLKDAPISLFYPFIGNLEVDLFNKMYMSGIIGISNEIQDRYVEQLLAETS